MAAGSMAAREVPIARGCRMFKSVTSAGTVTNPPPLPKTAVKSPATSPIANAVAGDRSFSAGGSRSITPLLLLKEFRYLHGTMLLGAADGGENNRQRAEIVSAGAFRVAPFGDGAQEL